MTAPTTDAIAEPVTRPTYRDTVERLSSAQKPKKGPPYTVYVNRAFGKRVAAAAHLLGMTPNQVTVVSACITFSGIAVLALGPTSPVTALAVALLLATGFAFDAADGQLARLRGGGSLSGEWLDHMVDSVKIASLHSAVAIHLFRSTDLADAWLLVPLGYAAVNVGSFFAQILSEQLVRNRRSGGAPTPAPAVTPTSLVRSVSLIPADYGILCWVFVLLGAPTAFLVVYGAFFAANAVHFVIATSNRFREMCAIDAEASR